MGDMQTGSTKVAFQLASPANRASTAAPGGYNMAGFDRMVRNSIYLPLLGGYGYDVTWHGKQGLSQYAARVRVFHDAPKQRWTVFRFVMSLQPPSVIDEDERLGAFKLARGHRPEWRTDSVMPVESGSKKTGSKKTPAKRKRSSSKKKGGSKKTPAKRRRSSSKKKGGSKKKRGSKKTAATKKTSGSKKTQARKKSGGARKKRRAKKAGHSSVKTHR